MHVYAYVDKKLIPINKKNCLDFKLKQINATFLLISYFLSKRYRVLGFLVGQILFLVNFRPLIEVVFFPSWR